MIIAKDTNAGSKLDDVWYKTLLKWENLLWLDSCNPCSFFTYFLAHHNNNFAISSISINPNGNSNQAQLY